MKKAVLLGDSLRLRGYGPHIPGLLGDSWEVWQSEDNGRFALYTFQSLGLYMHHLEGADVIHWNNGNWDVDDLYGDGPLVSQELYADILTRTARVLQKKAKRVIFAATTPVHAGYAYADNARIAAYNQTAFEALTPLGVEYNDLYSLVLPHLDTWIRTDDFIHLTDEGARYCAEAVARIIRGEDPTP